MADQDNIDPSVTISQLLGAKVEPPEFQAAPLEFAPTTLDPGEDRQLKTQAIGDALIAFSQIARGRVPGPIGTALKQRQAELRRAEIGNRALRNEASLNEARFDNSIRRGAHDGNLALQRAAMLAKARFDQTQGVDKATSLRRSAALIAVGKNDISEAGLSDEQITEIGKANGIKDEALFLTEAKGAIAQAEQKDRVSARNKSNSNEAHRSLLNIAAKTGASMATTKGLNGIRLTTPQAEVMADQIMFENGFPDNGGVRSFLTEGIRATNTRILQSRGTTSSDIRLKREIEATTKAAKTVQALALAEGLDSQTLRQLAFQGNSPMSEFAVLVRSDPEKGLLQLAETIDTFDTELEALIRTNPDLAGDPNFPTDSPIGTTREGQIQRIQQNALDKKLERIIQQAIDRGEEDPENDPFVQQQIQQAIDADRNRRALFGQ